MRQLAQAMSTKKSLELKTALNVLYTKLNDADFSNELSQIVDPATGLIQNTKVNYRYENNEGGFSENLAKEYAMFFEKTFDEINKNPAEKINKMLMKNNLSAKEILNILEKHSSSRKDEDSTKKRV